MFLIIWRGWGVLVPVFIVLGFVVGWGFSSVIPGPHTPYTLPVSFLVTGVVAATGIWFTARAIEARPGRVLVDKATGREFKVGANAGSLFFIPTRYWTFIVAGLALILAVTGLVSPHAFDTASTPQSPSSVSTAPQTPPPAAPARTS